MAVGFELIVVHHRLPVPTNVSSGHFVSSLLVLVAENPANYHRGRSFLAVYLLERFLVSLQFLCGFFPRLLRYYQCSYTQPGNYLRRLWGHRGSVGAAFEAFEGLGADVPPRLLDNLPVILAVPILQCVQHHFSRLGKASTGLGHVQPKPVKFYLGDTPPDSQYRPALTDVVQHRHFLGHSHRIMPWQYYHHGAQESFLGSTCHVGQELNHIRAHGVVGEMVFHSPYRLKTQWFGQVGHAELVAINLEVGLLPLRVLENRGHPYVHLITSVDSVAKKMNRLNYKAPLCIPLAQNKGGLFIALGTGVAELIGRQMFRNVDTELLFEPAPHVLA